MEHLVETPVRGVLYEGTEAGRRSSAPPAAPGASRCGRSLPSPSQIRVRRAETIAAEVRPLWPANQIAKLR